MENDPQQDIVRFIECMDLEKDRWADQKLIRFMLQRLGLDDALRAYTELRDAVSLRSNARVRKMLKEVNQDMDKWKDPEYRIRSRTIEHGHGHFSIVIEEFDPKTRDWKKKQ